MDWRLADGDLRAASSLAVLSAGSLRWPLKVFALVVVAWGNLHADLCVAEIRLAIDFQLRHESVFIIHHRMVQTEAEET